MSCCLGMVYMSDIVFSLALSFGETVLNSAELTSLIHSGNGPSLSVTYIDKVQFTESNV